MLLAFSDGCCPRIDWYWNGKKEQGSFIIQAEKVNENCHYVLEGGRGKFEDGIWMCGDSWWIGKISDKGQCKGWYHASTKSKPNVRVQNDSPSILYLNYIIIGILQARKEPLRVFMIE